MNGIRTLASIVHANASVWVNACIIDVASLVENSTRFLPIDPKTSHVLYFIVTRALTPSHWSPSHND